MKWILASASPRRKELLAGIGLPFEVIVSDAEEKTDKNLTPDELVKNLSEIKARSVWELCSKKKDPEEFAVIGSDTIVYHNGEVLGKPKDEEDAYRMLRSLSGMTHSVFTGVTLILPGGETIRFASETKVTFAELSDTEIRNYIATKEPMDKAGAYGIQSRGGAFVTHIDGEYATVVGFPIGEFCEILRKKGLFGV